MGVLTAKEFGSAIRIRRKKLGYTQAQLADACGVGFMFVSQLENGKETTQLEKALRVANMVGLTISLEERG